MQCSLIRLLALSLLTCLATLSAAAADTPDFDREVAPVLAARCLDCHSGSEPKGKLDLSQAKAMLTGGESGAAIVAGKPDESYLWQRIVANEMPPKHPLPAAERETIERWIAAGAKWGTDPIDPFRYTSAARAGYDWWSLQPVSRPVVPAVADTQAAIRNPIDNFILTKLAAAGLTPSPTADRAALIRRLYFDLIGLPPTSEEVEAGAYGEVVNKLLDSPHYGERWARHWLDVAHFGESDGFEFDRMRPHAWRYRDWVIDALNRDLPYDEFARLQIAGDVLRPGNDPAGNDEAVVATGFLVGGAHDSLQPKGEVMQMIMRQDELEDLVGLVSQTFLGLTANCARCHDHKFDPVRQTDYYRLAAALAGVKRGNRGLAPLEPPTELTTQHNRVKQELSHLERQARDKALAQRKTKVAEGAKPPQPIARWEFDGDLRDSIGNLHGAAYGRTRFDKGTLVVEGPDGYVATAPLERDLTEKTLEVWLRLRTIDQRGGAAIGVQTFDGKVFDALVFGEKEPRRWLAGSDNFRRTKPFAGAKEEMEAQQRLVHLAIVYGADGWIFGYRDGQSYGEAYQTGGPVTFAAGQAQVTFGLRHSPPADGKILNAKIERASLYDRALSAEEIAASLAAVGDFVSEAELIAQLDETDASRRTRLQTELQQLDERLSFYRNRQIFAVVPQTPPASHLLIRGNVQQPGEVVAPGGIVSFAASLPDFGLPADAPDAERRRRLAEWIASERNPLFARTIVNRVWQHHFGRGLVETSSDLGFSGGAPSHPELLDWLASELIANKWSLKALHRLIVTSATYQQASRPRDECLAADADNRLLWRYSPRRLEAEAVRDAMLLVAGQLNKERGGPSFMDFRPYMHKNAQYYEPLDLPAAEVHRRSIYRFWARGGRNPLLDTFDCPDPSTAVPRRAATTTPLQALAHWNNSFTLRMADHFAERLHKECPEATAAQLRRAFELACGRRPTAGEMDAAEAFSSQHGLAAFCRVLLNTNGFLYVH
jgi:hypothetical protein